jgi:hypothetical protein
MRLIAQLPVIYEPSDMSAASKQAGVERRLSRPESACGLLVGKTEQIDRHDRVPIRPRRGRDCREHPARLNGYGNVERGDRIHAIHRHRPGASRGEPAGGGVRVPERSHEVRQIVPAAQHPGSREDTRKGLLDQILGLVVRTAKRACDSVENSPMGD